MGYSKPAGKGLEGLFYDDASGYESRYDYLARQLPAEMKCNRCSRPACLVLGRQNDHLLCLRCRDDWSDYMDIHGHRMGKHLNKRIWEEIYGEFIRTQPGAIH